MPSDSEYQIEKALLEVLLGPSKNPYYPTCVWCASVFHEMEVATGTFFPPLDGTFTVLYAFPSENAAKKGFHGWIFYANGYWQTWPPLSFGEMLSYLSDPANREKFGLPPQAAPLTGHGDAVED